MKRQVSKWVFFIACLAWTVMANAQQATPGVKELELRRSDLLKQIQESESLLTSTKKNVTGQMNALATLTGQINERKRYLQQANDDLATINREINALTKQLAKFETELTEKRNSYARSLQHLQKNRSIEERLLFIFSAKTLEQTYRRARYVKEYAAFQRKLGEEIIVKQVEVTAKKEELGETKKARLQLLKELEEERQRLEQQEKQARSIVSGLQRKQKTLQNEINKKRKEANQLNARIDKLIAAEIEKSRKAAEAKGEKGSETKKTSKPGGMGTFTLSKADKELSGSFVNNRGKLPMPVTGSYTIVSRFGQYNVQGLKNVKLDNKGIDIQTRPGAEARVIFDGVVSAVFQFQGNGLFNVLVRHGNYISVYCNLSSTTVKQGDKVKTNQRIGTIFSDKTDGGRTVLHFQLRKEREMLNPEPWLSK